MSLFENETDIVTFRMSIHARNTPHFLSCETKGDFNSVHKLSYILRDLARDLRSGSLTFSDLFSDDSPATSRPHKVPDDYIL